MSLGPCFVPLHLNSTTMTEGASQRDIASVRLQHWRDMINRSRGMNGFRLPPGTGSKRKHKRNPRPGEVEMIMNGLQIVARYGSKEPVNA